MRSLLSLPKSGAKVGAGSGLSFPPPRPVCQNGDELLLGGAIRDPQLPVNSKGRSRGVLNAAIVEGVSHRRQIPLVEVEAHPHHCTPEVRREMLAKAPLFADLTADQTLVVDAACTALAADVGEAIYHAGEAAGKIFVVATGVVKTVRPGADGRQTILELSGPGDFFGVLPALGLETFPDTATAVTPSCVLALDADAFDGLVQRFPAVARASLRAVSQRLDAAHDSVHLLAGAPLEQRLASTLLLLVEKLGRAWQGKGLLIDAPLSRPEIAAMTGAATESVSRTLSTWKRRGLVDSGRRWIAVLDRSGLESLARG